MPCSTIRCGDAALIVLSSHLNHAGARREQAGNRFQQSRLAGAVGADERNHFARANHQIDTVQREKRAVRQVEDFLLRAFFIYLPFKSFKTFSGCAPFKPSPLFDAAQACIPPPRRADHVPYLHTLDTENVLWHSVRRWTRA